MADSCCEAKTGELGQLRASQARVLRIVLVVNAVLFVAEFTLGWVARSTALLGDSLDMFGDAVVYASSLWVLDRGMRWRARASLAKGYVQLVFGLLVLAQAGWKLLGNLDVEAGPMGAMATVALAGNGWCFFLFLRTSRQVITESRRELRAVDASNDTETGARIDRIATER